MSPHSPSLSLAPHTRWDSTLAGSRSSRERPDHAPLTPALPEQRQCPKEKKRVTTSSKGDGCHHPPGCTWTLSSVRKLLSDTPIQLSSGSWKGRGGESEDNRYTVTKNHLHAVLPALPLPFLLTLRDVPTSSLSCTSPSGIAAARHALRRLYTASVMSGGSMKERRSHSSRTQDTTDCTSVGMLTGEV